MKNSFESTCSLIVKLDLDDLQDYCAEVRYDGICDHLMKLSFLESAINSERSRLLTIARDLEGQISYSRKEVIYETNS